MIFYSHGVELLELIELFEIHRRSSHGWAIIDVVWVHSRYGKYTFHSHSFKEYNWIHYFITFLADLLTWIVLRKYFFIFHY